MNIDQIEYSIKTRRPCIVCGNKLNKNDFGILSFYRGEFSILHDYCFKKFLDIGSTEYPCCPSPSKEKCDDCQELNCFSNKG